jgi:hypothetical protein
MREVPMNKSMTALSLAAVLAFAGACGSTENAGPVASPKAGTNRPTEPPTGTQSAPVDTPTESDTLGSSTLSFGQTYEWDDGIQLTISAPKEFNPSEYAIGDGKNNLYMTVTLVNGSSEPFDPSMFLMTVQSGNEEAEAIFDTDTIGDAPQTNLLPGREAKFKVGYAVADPTDLVAEVAPSWDHETVFYSSK